MLIENLFLNYSLPLRNSWRKETLYIVITIPLNIFPVFQFFVVLN